MTPIQSIIEHVADHLGVDADLIVRHTSQYPCVKAPIVYARHLAMYLSRQYYNGQGKNGYIGTWPWLGTRFNMDHSSVMYGVGKVTKSIEAGDEKIVADLKAIKERMEQ